MKKKSTFLQIMLCCLFIMASAWSVQAQFSGNPLFAGADPEIRYFNNKYYIYPTTKNNKQFHAYSSSDLVEWKDEGVIFDIGPQCTWAEKNGWAPSMVYRNNKYYFYYTAETKIGVAVGNSPIGPFTDLGQPLIGTDPYTHDIIDAMVFIDDDEQAYIYYGGSSGSQMVARKLNANMISVGAAVNVTPKNYTEAPFMVKRDGVYYMMYSNGAWYNASYNVQYSTASSPMGPWTYRGKILSSNDEKKGPGHHSVLKIPGCDEYYIIYHRYEDNNLQGRKICIDHMYFNSSGLIDPINMTNYGVEARIPDNRCSAPAIVSGGIYKLTHKGTNQCLDVANNSSQSGTNVQQWTDNGNNAQRWIITLEADGYYKLTHKGTNQCLAANTNSAGTNVYQATDNGSDNQKWKLEIMSDGYLKLTHKGASLCLDVNNNSSQPGTNVRLWNSNSTSAQRWKLDLIDAPIVSGGTYRLMHKGTNQCLDVNNNSSQPGSRVQQWTDNGSNAQRWVITKENDGYYKLTHKGTNQCLDVGNNSSAAGANVSQWTDNGNNAQRWKLELMSDGYFKLIHKGTTQCLDVDNNSSAPGTNVQQWNDNNSDAQRWKLDLIPSTPINQLPTVKISAPTNNATYNAPASMTITAIASDADGDISKVEFYNGSTLIATEYVSPYQIAWKNIAAGTYSLTAKAFDNLGGVTTSSSITVTVKSSTTNNNPTISLTSPTNNSSYNAPASISISANASDSDGSIAKVEFYNGSQKLGERTSSPYTYTWTNVAAGNYTITAKATDNEGASKTSSAVSISVKTVVTDACSSIAQYVENGGYVAGSKVKNSGKQYQCKPFPYSGWCNGASWAYAPGTGTYWTDAWTLLGSCSARVGEEQTSTLNRSIELFPNPTENSITINIPIEMENCHIKISDIAGDDIRKTTLNGNMLDVSDLKAGIYILWIEYQGTTTPLRMIKQ